MSTETEMRQSVEEEFEKMNEKELEQLTEEEVKQSTEEEMEQLNEELEIYRSENEKMKKMLSTMEKINDLLTIQLNKCQCNQLFDFKLNTKLSVLKNKYEQLKYDINLSLNQTINTQMIVIKNDDKTQQLDNSLSDDDLNMFYSNSNEDNINDCIISEENDKLIDKKNIIYINVDNFKTIGNEINLCHNYAEIETNLSDNNSGNEEEEDQMSYSCEYSDSKSGLLCEKKFTNKETLLNHVMRHTGDRPWFCEWAHCHYRAKHRNHLVGHVRKSHTGRFQFKCDWPGCDFRGPSRYNVKRHKIIHTGEKPYKCDWPGCDFRSPNNKIAAHKRIHTGERPYACDWPGCEASFSRPFTLRNHKRTHTGEKPFVCDWPNCHYRSTQQTPLATHKRKHHSLGTVAAEEVIITENVIINDD